MTLQHRLELAVVSLALWVFRWLSPVVASNLGGWIARILGPLFPVSRIADRNLQMAMPELDGEARRRVIRGVWESLGRNAGEFPHLAAFRAGSSGPGWEYANLDRVGPLRAQGGPAILFTGHIGNWEVLPLAAAHVGLSFATVYRPAANPAVDALILRQRRVGEGVNEHLFPKGAQGARLMLQHLRRGGVVGMLVDQKMNDGIEARFFGRPAMTASALAAVALRLRCPVLGGYARRVGPARFVIEVEEPLVLPDTGDREADILAMTQAVNDQLESWIRRAPESWLWLHRRWPKADYADLR